MIEKTTFADGSSLQEMSANCCLVAVMAGRSGGSPVTIERSGFIHAEQEKANDPSLPRNARCPKTWELVLARWPLNLTRRISNPDALTSRVGGFEFTGSAARAPSPLNPSTSILLVINAGTHFRSFASWRLGVHCRGVRRGTEFETRAMRNQAFGESIIGRR